MALASTLSSLSRLRVAAPSSRSRSPAAGSACNASLPAARAVHRSNTHVGSSSSSSSSSSSGGGGGGGGTALAPDERDSFGQTPLIRAAADGNTAAMQRLLQQGADVNAQDEWGSGSLHLAAAKGHAAAVALLLRHGAEVDARDSRGRTPLAAVSQWGAYTFMENLAILAFPSPYSARGACQCAAALVAAGADVNTRDDMGVTPLARLAQTSMDEHAEAAVRLLLAAGADGCPALEAALHYENQAALEVLISTGVDATALLAAKLEFTRARGLAADEALLLLRAGAGIEALPLQLKQFAIELAMRDHADRA